MYGARPMSEVTRSVEGMTTVPELTVREAAMLALEAEHPSHSAAKEQAITDRLGISAARYYQLLSRLIRARAAVEADPLLVGRIRRLHAQRRARFDAVA